MAFVSSSLPQEEQNQLGPQGQTTPNPLSMLPPQAAQTGGSAGQGGSQASATNAGSPTQFGTTASKLSDYLSANKDQVQGMANQIASGLGNQYNTVKGGIDQAGQSFSDLVNKSYTPYDQNVIDQAQANPIDYAKDPNNVTAFQKQLNDQYTGPSNFEGSDQYANAQKGLPDAVQQASQLNTYPGLSTYLQNNVEKNATPGQNTLDSILLYGNQPAFQTVQNAAQPFSGLQDYLSQIAGTQNQNIKQAQQVAPQAQQAAQAALGTATGNLNTGINQELQQALGKVQGYNTEVQKAQGDLASDIPLINQLRDIMSQYGAGFTNGATPPWADPTKVTIPNQVMALPNAGQVANPQDYAMLQALQQLSGSSVQSPIDMTTANQAGTFKEPGQVDRSQLQNAYQSMYDFLNDPANKVSVNSGQNANPFVTEGNQWYNNLLDAFGYDYKGTGPRPAVFQLGQNAPPLPGDQGGFRGV